MPKTTLAGRRCTMAAEKNASATAEVLLKQGADANTKDNLGSDAAALCGGEKCFCDGRGVAEAGSRRLTPKADRGSYAAALYGGGECFCDGRAIA